MTKIFEEKSLLSNNLYIVYTFELVVRTMCVYFYIFVSETHFIVPRKKLRGRFLIENCI